MTSTAGRITSPQREMLECLAAAFLPNFEVTGPGRNCLRRLMYRGLVDCIEMPDARDNYWEITNAGRAALAAKTGGA